MRKTVFWGVLVILCSLNGCGSSGGGGATGNGGSGGLGGAGGTATGGNSGGGGSGGGSGGGGGADAGGTGNGGSSGAGGTGVAGACGSDTSNGSGDTCNSAPADGPCVTEQLSNSAAPTAAGGTITAGTYVLTSMTLYGASDGGDQQSDRRETFVVSSVTATAFTLDQVQVSGTRIERSQGTVVVAGTTVTYTPVCPPPGDGGDNGGSASYTATATTFSLIESRNGGTRVSVYTKQ